MGFMPEMPLQVASQNASLPIPLAATTPSPVITTRRFVLCAILVYLMNLDIERRALGTSCQHEVQSHLQLPIKPVRPCENECAIHTAKTTGMGQSHVDVGSTSYVGHVV